MLYQRINERVLRMVERGWVEEVEALVAAGYAPQIGRLKARWVSGRSWRACGANSRWTPPSPRPSSTTGATRNVSSRGFVRTRASTGPYRTGVSVAEQRDRSLAIVARLGTADDGGAIHRHSQANVPPDESADA